MNTRFCPTANGDAQKGILHLGHIYMVMVNRYMADVTGGRFIVRFDDDQQYWVQELGKDRVAENCRKIMEELTWLGIRPASYCWQSTRSDGFAERIHAVMPHLYENALAYVVPIVPHDDLPHFPDAQYIIAETVLHDWQDGIDQLIIGDELLSRFSAYRLWADLLRVPQIAAPIHLPRLRDGAGELASVSKTIGNHRLQDYRDKGYKPADVYEVLRESCLVNPAQGWHWKNVQAQPILEAVYA